MSEASCMKYCVRCLKLNREWMLMNQERNGMPINGAGNCRRVVICPVVGSRTGAVLRRTGVVSENWIDVAHLTPSADGSS